MANVTTLDKLLHLGESRLNKQYLVKTYVEVYSELGKEVSFQLSDHRFFPFLGDKVTSSKDTNKIYFELQFLLFYKTLKELEELHSNLLQSQTELTQGLLGIRDTPPSADLIEQANKAAKQNLIYQTSLWKIMDTYFAERGVSFFGLVVNNLEDMNALKSWSLKSLEKRPDEEETNYLFKPMPYFWSLFILGEPNLFKRKIRPEGSGISLHNTLYTAHSKSYQSKELANSFYSELIAKDSLEDIEDLFLVRLSGILHELSKRNHLDQSIETWLPLAFSDAVSAANIYDPYYFGRESYREYTEIDQETGAPKKSLDHLKRRFLENLTVCKERGLNTTFDADRAHQVPDEATYDKLISSEYTSKECVLF